MTAAAALTAMPRRESAEAAELRRAINIPAHVAVPYRLCVAVAERITVRREEWVADCRRIVDAFVAMGAFSGRTPAADDIVRYLRSRGEIGPGRKLRLLQHARRLLKLLDMPVPYSTGLLDYRRALVTENNDRRRKAIAISNYQGATEITIDDLVPAVPTTLADAVDRLALLSIESFAGRADEGTDVPLCLIRSGPRSTFVDRAWSKTDGRTYALSPEVIDASNLICTFPGCEGRPRIGIDPDHVIEACGDAFIPKLSSSRTRIRPGTYGRQWLRVMLRRRVRAWLKANDVPVDLSDEVVALVTGRALRRGRNAAEAYSGTADDEQAAKSNLKTRTLVMKYSDGLKTEGTLTSIFVLGALGRAQRGEAHC